jgi:hypothetical protein
MAIQASGVDAWLTLNDQPFSFQQGTENRAAGVTEYRECYFRSTRDAPPFLKISIDGQYLTSEHEGYWRWTPKEYAGLYELVIRARDGSSFRTRLRVFPQKLTLALYEMMQQELSEVSVDLLIKIWSKATEKTISVQYRYDPSPLHDFLLVKALCDQLQDIMAHICRDPQCTLQQDTETLPSPLVRHFGTYLRPASATSVALPEQIAHTCRTTHIPEVWEVPRTLPSYDTYENRLLKTFLEKQLVNKISIIQQRAEKALTGRKTSRRSSNASTQEMLTLERMIDDCRMMKRRCLVWSDEPFLRSVSTMVGPARATQVLQKNPSYNRFYRIYLQFQQKLKMSIDTETFVTEVAMRKVSELYEMWSVFKVTQWVIDIVCAQNYIFVSQSLFHEIDKDHFYFDVRKNIPGIVLSKGDRQMVIKYEPIYPHHSLVRQPALVSDKGTSLKLTPDLSVEIYRQGKPETVLIFEAKYKRERGNDREYHPKSDDIDTMNMYYNSILYKSTHDNSTPLEPVVSSAYVLFPGRRVSQNARHTIGGLPILPRMGADQVERVKKVIEGLLKMAGIF